MRPHFRILLVFLSGAVLATGAAPAAGADCHCPREGYWNAQNLKGWMNCTGPVNVRRELKEVKDKGTIWILEHHCESVFGEAFQQQDEDVLMERAEDCSFAGTVSGEEDGVRMVIDITWSPQSDEFITGEMTSAPSFQGMTCEFYRPFELRFNAPIADKDYDKLKRKMEKKLAQVRRKQ